MTSTIRPWAAGLLIAAVSLGSSAAWAAEAIAPSAPVAQPGPPPGLSGKPEGEWSKADGAIRGLVAEFRAHRSRSEPGEFRPSNTTLQFARGRVVVDIVAQDDPEALIEELGRLGLRDASSYGRIISGELPIGAIQRAVALPGLQAISAARQPHTNSAQIGAGSVISEGVQAMYADIVQEGNVSGVGALTGAGFTIGVLSDSFDQQGGYADGQASGDLPAGINVLDDTANCGSACSDEGRAMMELAFDVAPGANFAFHTAFGGMADFANGIEELAAAGSDIIVDDVLYFGEPMFQDGIIAQAADNVVSGGVPYFSSAGNMAERSYETGYVNSGEPFYVDVGFGPEYAGMLHAFDGVEGDPGTGVSGDWHQDLTVPAYPSHRIISLILQWDQPFASLSTGNTGAEVDLDIYLTSTPEVVDGEEQASTLYASSRDNNALSNGGTGEPLELLQFQVGGCDGFLQLFYGIGCVPKGEQRLLIAYYDGGTAVQPGATLIEPTRLKYVIFDHILSWQHPTDSSTTYGHANAAGAMAVGAAFWQATPAWGCDYPAAGETYDDCEENVMGEVVPQLEWFSSRGGTPILFDDKGNAIPGAEPRLKPGVVGPDGTNTTFFFNDSETDEDDNPNFFGTSASAPHVAAVAALMLEANPALAPAEIYALLEETAQNMNPRGGQDPDGEVFDFDTGWGFVHADLAVAAAVGGGDMRPSVEITAPAEGDTVSGTVAITATASDDDAVTQVEFFVGDTTSVGVDGAGTDGWTAEWDSTTYGDGPHTIKATATDTAGQTASDSVSVTVDNVDDPPSVTVTAPADGATVSGTVTITADAADDRGVSQVEFFHGSNSIDTDTDGSDGWSASWVSTTVADGSSHTLTATATDNGSNTASDSVTVTVDNSIAANEPPVASFSVAQNPCPFDSFFNGWVCQFNNESTDDGGVPTESWEWNYGDGTGETGIWSPTALYSVPGTYTVTLTVTDSDDASDSTSQPVAMAVSAHLGDLDAARVSSGGRWEAQVIALVLDNRSAPLEGAVVEGSWSNGASGNGSCTTGASGQCTIARSNLKNNVDSVTFTVNNIGGTNIAYDALANVDPDGDSYGADENMIDVSQSEDTSTNQPPVASFSVAQNPCPFNSLLGGWLCDFNNTSSDDGGVPTASWVWDYGDGTNETAVWEPDALYDVEGFYTVTLTITDSDGASDSASLQVQIGNAETPPLFLESAEGFKDKGVQYVNLTWSGGPAGDVEIHQDGVEVLETPNDGSETYNIGNKGGGSYNFKVCELGGNNCSNNIQVIF